MDIHGINRLAKLEYERRVQSMPVVPEYEAPNVEIQPGWIVRLAQRLISMLQRPERHRSNEPERPISVTQSTYYKRARKVSARQVIP